LVEFTAKVVDVPEVIRVPGASGLPGTFLYQLTIFPAGTPPNENADGVVPLQTLASFPVGAGGCATILMRAVSCTGGRAGKALHVFQ
jgi:hypothetical protein